MISSNNVGTSVRTKNYVQNSCGLYTNIQVLYNASGYAIQQKYKDKSQVQKKKKKLIHLFISYKCSKIYLVTFLYCKNFIEIKKKKITIHESFNYFELFDVFIKKKLGLSALNLFQILPGLNNIIFKMLYEKDAIFERIGSFVLPMT